MQRAVTSDNYTGFEFCMVWVGLSWPFYCWLVGLPWLDQTDTGGIGRSAGRQDGGGRAKYWSERVACASGAN